MPQQIPMLGVVVLALTGLVGWGLPAATAAPGTSGANVAQVDHVSPWTCAASATSPPQTWPRPPLRWWGIPPTRLHFSSGCHLRRAMRPKFST
jgi:hypothetical protein